MCWWSSTPVDKRLLRVLQVVCPPEQAPAVSEALGMLGLNNPVLLGNATTTTDEVEFIGIYQEVIPSGWPSPSEADPTLSSAVRVWSFCSREVQEAARQVRLPRFPSVSGGHTVQPTASEAPAKEPHKAMGPCVDKAPKGQGKTPPKIGGIGKRIGTTNANTLTTRSGMSVPGFARGNVELSLVTPKVILK